MQSSRGQQSSTNVNSRHIEFLQCLFPPVAAVSIQTPCLAEKGDLNKREWECIKVPPVPARTELALFSRLIKPHLIPLNPTMGMTFHKVNKVVNSSRPDEAEIVVKLGAGKLTDPQRSQRSHCWQSWSHCWNQGLVSNLVT